MPEPAPIAIVLDARLAGAAGLVGEAGVLPVPGRRPIRSARRRRRDPRAHADVALEALEASPGAVVLVRPAAADPDASALGALARTLGREVVLLPAHPGEAAWVCAMALAWVRERPAADVVRRAQAAAGLAGTPSCPVRRADWRGTGLRVPALRPEAVGRWCARAWRRCGWCRGGGLVGRACGRCGAPVGVLEP